MAYWQFDLTFVNLGALPAGSEVLAIQAVFENSQHFITGQSAFSPPGSVSVPMSTTNGQNGSFELDYSAKVWFMVTVIANNQRALATTLGPSTVGDIGTEKYLT